MSAAMWDNPSVRRNTAVLHDDGVSLIGPANGWLSCRKQGLGRMAEPEDILASIVEKLA